MTNDDREKRIALLLAGGDDVDWDRVEHDEGERWAADIALLKGRLREVEQRAEKAEAAAREMGQAIDIHAPESRAWAALARHPEYAPDHDFLPGETGERYPSKP